MSKISTQLDEFFPAKKRPSQKKRGRRVVLGGKSETGKTYFACTAPEPVILFDIDDGTEALWEQYDDITGETYEGNFADRDIRIVEIPIDVEIDDHTIENLDDAEIIEFATSLVNALNTLEIEFAKIEKVAKAGGLDGGTFVMDTISWVWMASMDRMKYKILQLDPTAKNYVKQMWDWDIANKKYINLYKRMMGLSRHGVNVIILAHTKDKYDEKEEKGKKKIVKSMTEEVFHWMKKTPQMSPLILHARQKMAMVEGVPTLLRETNFVRMRGVPNAARIARPIYDLSWDKLMEELHYIRIVHEEGGIDSPVPDKPTRRRRRKSGDKPAEASAEVVADPTPSRRRRKVDAQS